MQVSITRSITFTILCTLFICSISLAEVVKPKAGTHAVQKTYDIEVNSSKGKGGYLSDLIKKANGLNLSEDPTWVTLMHYKTSIILGTESQVDSAGFFLSDAGKFEPQKEMEATIAAFFSDIPVAPSKYSPQCRFPARYLWLNKKLNFDNSKLPKEECSDLKQYYKAIDPASLTIIFPSTHPNSPSSMFGHTLLRVNKKQQTEQTRMLAFSINYAAQIDPEEGALSYSVLGLTGGFAGKFMILPYYVKLREYAQIENRDLWEYDLNIPPEKLHFILLHAFELAYSYFDYYFFTENCSYHLLSLLDVAYAEDPMSNEFLGWTIPVDTLKVLKERNLITQARFYPSIARKIEFRREALNEGESNLVLKAEREGISSVESDLNLLTDGDKVQVLDLLTDYLRYRKIELSEKKVSSKLSKPERQVLLYRSKIKQKSSEVKVPSPGLSPEQGHGTSRVGLTMGLIDDESFYDLEWRPAYHDILDSSTGFVSSSGLEFMKLKLRYSPTEENLHLQEVTLLNIESLVARDDYFKSFSWRAHVRWQNESDAIFNNRSSLLEFNGGSGVAYKWPKLADAIFYGFLNARLYVNKEFKESHSLLPNMEVGYIFEPLNGWRLNAKASYGESVFGERLQSKLFGVGQSFALSQNSSVRLNLKRSWLYSRSVDAIDMQFFYYF